MLQSHAVLVKRRRYVVQQANHGCGAITREINRKDAKGAKSSPTFFVFCAPERLFSE